MRLEVIVNPAREHGRFHRRAPRLWQRFHPQVQVKACGGKRSFGENLATAFLHAVADLPLVNIQSDVIHRFHGGASFGVSESASAEFSFSTPSAPPSTYTFKLIVTEGTKPRRLSARQENTDAGRIRENIYNVSFCFELEPTPNSISHSLTLAPITSGWSSCR